MTHKLLITNTKNRIIHSPDQRSQIHGHPPRDPRVEHRHRSSPPLDQCTNAPNLCRNRGVGNCSRLRRSSIRKIRSTRAKRKSRYTGHVVATASYNTNVHVTDSFRRLSKLKYRRPINVPHQRVPVWINPKTQVLPAQFRRN